MDAAVKESTHDPTVRDAVAQSASPLVRTVLTVLGLLLLGLAFAVPRLARGTVLYENGARLLLWSLAPMLLLPIARQQRGEVSLALALPIRWVLCFAVAALILATAVLLEPGSPQWGQATLWLVRLLVVLPLVGLLVGARAWLRLARLCPERWVPHSSPKRRVAVRAGGFLLLAGALLMPICTLWAHGRVGPALWGFILSACALFAAVGIRALRRADTADLVLLDWPFCGALLGIAVDSALERTGGSAGQLASAPIFVGCLLLLAHGTAGWRPKETGSAPEGSAEA